MTKTELSVIFLTVLMMTTTISISADYVGEASALKSKGTSVSKYGSKTNVCGVQLCSEYPGGKAAWEATQSTITTIQETKQPHEMKQEQTMKQHKMSGAHSYKSMTGTLESIIDPGIGHEGHSLAIILPPSDKMYKGLLTYSASEPIQLVALHGPLGPGEDNGQPIWTPDGETKFALTFVDPETDMGTWEFTGNAIAVHTKNTDGFTVSYSVAATKS